MTGKLTARRPQPVGAVAQRDELIRKRDAAYNAYADYTRQRQECERAMAQLKRQLESDEAGEDVEGAYAQTQRDYDRSLAKANVNLDRVKGLEAEIEALYGREFQAFAEEASKVTATATVACDDFLAAWRRCKPTWQAATEAWAPLCRSVRIEGVRPFPVTEHQLSELLNGEAVAQPPGVEIFDDAEPLTD